MGPEGVGIVIVPMTECISAAPSTSRKKIAGARPVAPVFLLPLVNTARPSSQRALPRIFAAGAYGSNKPATEVFLVYLRHQAVGQPEKIGRRGACSRRPAPAGAAFHAPPGRSPGRPAGADR